MNKSPGSLHVFAGVLFALLAVRAHAQDRPFLFSFSSTGWSQGGALVYYEPGYAERSPDQISRDGFESRFGVEARHRRLSVLSSLSLAEDGASSMAAFRVEGLYDLVGQSAGFRLSAGLGYLREAEGISVGVGRVIAEGRFGEAWRAAGNLRFEKPFATGRDEVDVITTVGLSRRLATSWGVGIEMVGEDLEALWEEEEAEGGGRLLVGPSLHYGAPGGKLGASLCGGPVFGIRTNPNTSGAVRSLGTGYAVRLSLAYVF